ncbi:MAG: hypothetical protein F4138_04940 [Acidimicrobiia bacterium]|nr:hypothetical protein [Acidimicrobiia bacterium]MYC58189.1 hypothetical protein [Acidimicrobiia bacterium]MYG94324.1 hypothetical protein [Acidimicrobiia bacterium]MYI30621.1 hypothetical protein [Acidimicrobiia bacterium]
MNLEVPADSFFDTIVRLPLFEVESLQELVSLRADSGTPEERVALEKIAGPVLDAGADMMTGSHIRTAARIWEPKWLNGD